MIAEAAVRAGVRDIELSKSVAKARIPSKCRKRIVDIPRFYSRPIPARGAFATDLDTPPPRTVPGAPPAPVGLLAHRFTRVRYALFPLLRPSTLHCTRRRGAAGSEGAQQTRRGAADDSGAPSRGPRGRRPGAPRCHHVKGLIRDGAGPACVMRAQRNAIHPASRRAGSARHDPPALDPREPTWRNASPGDITESTPPGRGRAQDPTRRRSRPRGFHPPGPAISGAGGRGLPWARTPTTAPIIGRPPDD